MSPVAWIVALMVTLLAATVQGDVGMGFAMVSVPVLALIDPSLAPVPQLLMTLPVTVTMAWRERDHLRLSGIGWVIAGRFPGAAIGVALLAVATRRTLEVAIAITVFAAVAVLASGFHLRRNALTEFGAGVFSGTSGLVASVGGPPLALLYSQEEGPVIRSNLAAIFTIGISITVLARMVSGNITWEDVRISAILLPALLIGYVLSLRIKDRVSQSMVRNAILVLSALGAGVLLFRAVV
jgi:uncharacterized membrane protein YfcA